MTFIDAFENETVFLFVSIFMTITSIEFHVVILVYIGFKQSEKMTKNTIYYKIHVFLFILFIIIQSPLMYVRCKLYNYFLAITESLHCLVTLPDGDGVLILLKLLYPSLYL